MSKPLNATATKDTTCTACGQPIAKDERCAMFRERALTSAEARHGGMHPLRRWCAACAK